MARSFFPGNASSYQVLLAHLPTALTTPLIERCMLLTQILQESPIKDLQYVFPAVVESVFGFRTGVDWGLLGIDKNIQCREFDSLRRFLASDGPLLKLTLKFTEEFLPKFEFPIACLPLPTQQQLLQEGKVPPLYANKIQAANPGFLPSVLQLNAFEFYLFHFTYFIVNSAVKNSLITVNHQDTLYAHILEDYLYSFLPTNNRAVPLFQSPSNAQHSPILSASLSANYGNSSTSPGLQRGHCFSTPDFLSPLRQKPSLLKKEALMMMASGGFSPSHGSPAESWKSETFVLILREIFLGQNSVPQQQRSSPVLIPKTFVATHYHVWMVRIMVKHLHFFFNSSLSSNQSTGHGQIMIDSLGRLKSLGMTQLLHKEIYGFLKSTLDHWPLDASFRVPLETYLSYIQPWRYIQCDLEPSVWQKFMTENLVFYTTMFQQILRRFLRMDLSCPKNAYMLFRLTKVICSGELREMIKQAEASSLSKPSGLSMSSGLYHSPEQFSLRKHSSQVEAAGYPPLFSQPVFLMVTQLLSSINTARREICVQSPSYSDCSKGFLSKVCSFFETSGDGIDSDDNSPSDIRKVDSYLETSSKQLSHFFPEVIPPPLSIAPPVDPMASPTLNYRKQADTNSRPYNLTNSERMQLLRRKRKPDIRWEENPDLQPVRTYEVPFLVHLLNNFSQHLNEMYSSEIGELYNSNSFVGSVSRKLLFGPATYYEVHKWKDMRPTRWEPVHLPARVNLRVVAHKQLWGYLIFYMLISYAFGYLFHFNPIFSFIFLMILLVIGLFASTVLSPVPIPDKDD